MSGFQMIPRRLLAAIEHTPPQLACAVIVCLEADRKGWQPFPCSASWLSTRAGVTRFQAQRFINTALDFGAITEVRAGGRRNAKLILIPSPAAENEWPFIRKHDLLSSQSTSQSASHNDNGHNGVSGQSPANQPANAPAENQPPKPANIRDYRLREETRPIAEVSLGPEVRRFLALASRWSSDEAPAPKRWRVERARDVDWFLGLLGELPGLDVVGELDKIDLWLETQARSNSKSFWKGWKAGIRRWLLKAAEGISKPKGSQGIGGGQKTASEAAQAALSRLRRNHIATNRKPTDLDPPSLAGLEAMGGWSKARKATVWELNNDAGAAFKAAYARHWTPDLSVIEGSR